MRAEILITNIKGLVQVRNQTSSFVAGTDQASLPVLENAFLHIRDGLIADYGSMSGPQPVVQRKIDAGGCFVFPGFVDSHTHLVFGASREEEFVMKIRGATYQEIAARGGGILNSARVVQQLSEDELFRRSLPRAWEIMRSGTAVVEIKSGYGLTLKDELKMLRVARRIGKETPLTVKTTFLGAHAIPAGTTKEDYIRLIIREMIPAVAAEGLADYIDAFCETGFFTPDETVSILEEGSRHGLIPRLHANQLSNSGGVQAGVKCKAISVDHLENAGDEEIECLKGTMTMPTALPGAAFFLNLPYPPVRRMLSAGLPVAIASDFNPGSAPSGNMSLMIALACIKMRMTPEEAINAATINTAYTLGLLGTHGSITRGKEASVFITRPIPSVASIPYLFGSNLVDKVILKGERLPGLNDPGRPGDF
jgi:imidazolonepropionase